VSAISFEQLARVIRQARSVTDLLKEISAADLKFAIEQREGYQRSEQFAAMPDGAAKRGGVDLTETLKLILSFREQIIRAEPTNEDQAAAAALALEHFRDHPNTQAASFFREGGRA
jgi:hypothetical protein